MKVYVALEGTKYGGCTIVKIFRKKREASNYYHKENQLNQRRDVVYIIEEWEVTP